MKKCSVALFLCILFIVQAHGQDGPVSAAGDSKLNGPINGADACAAAGIACRNHGPASPSTSASYGPLGTFGIVAAPALVGALAGSFVQDPQGRRFIAGGGVAGAGLGLDLATHRLKSKTAKVLAVTLGNALVAGSATQAWQFHQAWRKHLENGYVPPPQITEDKQIGEIAGAAAVVTAVVAMLTFHQDKAKITKLESAHPIIRALTRVKISGTLQRMGAGFTW
jgi:hypothetical protein